MHDAERRQEDPETEPMAEVQKRHHQHEIGDGFDDEENEVERLHYDTSAAGRRRRADAAIAAADPLIDCPKKSNTRASCKSCRP